MPNTAWPDLATAALILCISEDPCSNPDCMDPESYSDRSEAIVELSNKGQLTTASSLCPLFRGFPLLGGC